MLIDDLENELPGLIALGLQRCGGLAGYKLITRDRNTIQQEVNRLKRAIHGSGTRSGLCEVLRALASQHHHVLRPDTIWRQRQHARRPHPAHLQHALFRANNLDDDKRILAVLDQTVEHSVDVYENQLVKLFVHQVQQRFQSLLKQNVSDALRTDLLQIRSDLRSAAMCATFLEEVTLPTSPPRRLTMVFIRNPFYRAAMEGFIEFQRNVLIDLEEPLLEAPLDNLPLIYQRWCTLRVIVALLDWAESNGFRVFDQQIVHVHSNSAYVQVLKAGRALVLGDKIGRLQLAVYIEKTYGRNSRGLRSISFPQRPDIALELSIDGTVRDVLILDPKYRLDSGGDPMAGVPVKADVDKMHAYRDAIKSEDSRKPVSFAATLYTGQTQLFGNEIAALRFRPGEIEQSCSMICEELDRMQIV